MGYCRRRYGTREMRLKTSGKNQYLCHPVNPIMASRQTVQICIKLLRDSYRDRARPGIWAVRQGRRDR